MTPSLTFARAMEFVGRWEGGKVDDPIDPGGRTAYGVTQAVYSDWLRGQGRPDADVWCIRQDEIDAIYHVRYWQRGRCDLVLEASENIAIAHFDACVNCGTRQAGRFLQRAINTLRGSAVLKVDGWIGPKTLAFIHAAESRAVVRQMIDERAAFYNRLAERKPPLRRFLRGWLNRVNDLRTVTG